MLSIKLFGANEFAVRLPSVILSSLLSLVVFRIGNLLFGPREGFIAAVLMATNNFILEHVSAYYGMDHNDISFMFYVTLSVWAWIEYEQKKKNYWIVFAGIFVGCAVLNKWVTGIVMFSGFLVYHVFLMRDFFSRRIFLHFLLAAGSALIVAVPWQCFILYNYPAEARYEYAFSSKHFWEVVENHKHEFWFYINRLKYDFSMLQCFIFFGILFTLFSSKNRKLRLGILTIVIATYSFFTLAESKVVSYIMVVTPLVLVFIGGG